MKGSGERYRESTLKRIVDVVLAVAITAIVAVPCVVIAIAIKCTSRGPILYWSQRVGYRNRLFCMPKFRTMQVGTPALPTHLLDAPRSHLTPIGGVLRRSSFDEVPQLWSILCGEMSFVGPRPALFNQDDLIALRTACCVHTLVPGLTGWAQINGRDDLPSSEKVRFDKEYLDRRSLRFDFAILWQTVIKVATRDGVSH